MRARRLVLLAGLALALARAGFAQTPVPQPLQDPGDRLLREEAARERRERLEQEPARIEGGERAPRAAAQEAVESIAEPGPSFLIERIVLDGDNVLRAAAVRAIVDPFTGRQLGANRINRLLERLNQAFVEWGLITTRAYVREQNLAAGTLTVTVVAGRIEVLEYEGRPLEPGGWDRPAVRLAFPTAAGDVLRLQDLEQGVDQMNRLRRNRTEVQIQPGETPGGSRVSIRNPQGDRFYYSLGADNSGSEPTGLHRVRAGVEANDLLGLQDALALSFVGTQDSNALLFSAAVPVGYHTLSYLYSYAEFQNLVADTAILFGTTRNQVFDWSMVLGRSARGVSNLDLSLGLRRATREIGPIQLAPQRLTVLRAGYSRLQRVQSGAAPGFWVLDLGLSRGLDVLGANRDPDDLPGGVPRAQFTKFDFGASLGVPIPRSAWNVRTAAAGQWSRDALYGSEQIFIGGAATVRGFAEAALSGDRGAYLRNEAAPGALAGLLGEGVVFQPFLFADAGTTQFAASGPWRSLVGAGAGARATTRFMAAEVVLAWPLYHPDALPDVGFRIHATLNVVF